MKTQTARFLACLATVAVSTWVWQPSLAGPTVSTHSHALDHGSTGLTHVQPDHLQVIPPGRPGPIRSTSATSVAFRPSGRSALAEPRRNKNRVQVFQTGAHALEPTLGVDSKGRLFYMAGMAGDQWPLFPSHTLRTSDNGKTWDDVTPDVPHDHPTTEDPYLYVDEETDRVFSSDFMLPCTAISHSDDAGATWASTVAACDLMDHQTIFAGPPVTSETVGYPNIVYYCAADYTIGGMGVSCLKSIDGGLVFVRSGLPAFSGIEAQSQQCGWGSGHGVVGPLGTVFVPAGVCGEPMLAISKNEGATWERVRVAGMMMGNDGRRDHDAAVAVDSKNNLYYSWTGADLKPYLAVSTDGGTTWSTPVMIAPPGVKIATLIALDVSSPGNLAISFVGSETRDAFGLGEYSGFVMKTTEALSEDPLFYASRINPANDPIDGGCSTGSCATNREFIDVAIAPDGAVWASFSDGCYDGACGHYPMPLVGLPVGRGLAVRFSGRPQLH